MKTLLAIPGSLRPGSSNHSILQYLGTLLPENIYYSIYGDLKSIPPFDPADDGDSPPAPIVALRELVTSVDAIIICTPEYAYGIPGQLKNALDWMVSSGSFSGKLTALITASTGGENAHEALKKVLGAIDTNRLDELTLLISFIRSKMNTAGQITDNQTAEQLKALADNLAALI